MRVRWPRRQRAGAGFTAPAAAPATLQAIRLPGVSSALRRVLEEHGTPEVEGAGSPKDEAIVLLKLAAEIEHALLVQYLYAAASVAGSAPGGVDSRSKIMTVAAQEMGHLISVQNLLLAIGGTNAMHLGRDSMRASALDDNPIPLRLEPISHSTLARFIVAEMPAKIPDGTLQQRVDQLIVEARAAAGVEPHRVGALYAKLFWLFQPTDAPAPPLNLSPEPSVQLHSGAHLQPADFVSSTVRDPYSAMRAEWVRGGVPDFKLAEVTDAASAMKLIAEISAQGEGLEDAHDSHFFEFVELLDDFEAGRVAVTDLPKSPVARIAAAPDADVTTPIVTPYAKLWAEIFDLRYNFLLLDLWHAMSTDRNAAARAALIELAYANMEFVDGVTRQLLGLRAAGNADDAAPPFGLMFEDLPATDALRWARHRTLLASQQEIVRSIEESPEFKDADSGEILDFDGSVLLANLSNSDADRQSLIAAHLGT
jgi:hypothetical protein